MMTTTSWEGSEREKEEKITIKGHEETFAVMGIFFTLIVVTVSWYTLRNVNVIYVNCTSINTCTIFKIQKNTS